MSSVPLTIAAVSAIVLPPPSVFGQAAYLRAWRHKEQLLKVLHEADDRLVSYADLTLGAASIAELRQEIRARVTRANAVLRAVRKVSAKRERAALCSQGGQ
jgi:hypothetical protein